MEFLDHCMKTHEKSTVCVQNNGAHSNISVLYKVQCCSLCGQLLDEVDPFDLQEILESAHRDNRLHEEQPFQWPIQELVSYLYCYIQLLNT